jgi:hypothetical protein
MNQHYYILEIFSRKKWRETIGRFQTLDEAQNEYHYRKHKHSLGGKFPPHRIKEIYHVETLYNL